MSRVLAQPVECLNAAVPFLNKLIQKKYGFVAPRKEAAK